MKTRSELVSDLKEKNAQVKALFSKDVEGENDMAELDSLTAERDTIKSEILAMDEAEDNAAKIARATKETEAVDGFLKQPVRQPTSPIKEEAVTSGVHARVLDDPTGGFARYDDFLNDVQTASRPGGAMSENLLELNSAYGNNSESGTDGGFLIPPEYSNRIFSRVENELPILSKCDRVAMTSNSIKLNGTIDHDASSTTYRYGGVIPYWVDGGAEITKSQLNFNKIGLDLHKIAALSFVTEEEMTDVANFGSRLLDSQSVAIKGELTNAIMFGTGVGQPLGAFTGTSPCVEVAIETDQAADTVVAENLIKMYGVVYGDSVSRGEWYFNSECWEQLATMALSVGTGGMAAFMPAGGVSATPYNTIFGRPAYPTGICKKLGDAGDIVFADWSEYLLGIKGTIDTAMSIHLRFDFAEAAYRSMFRVDGRPKWSDNFKPRNGATDRRESPFTKLAERA